MKKALVILFVMFSFTVFAEAPTIPKAVKDSFSLKFETAEDISWELLDGNYEATFYLEEELTLALFSPKGEWLETATSIYTEDIPEKVLDALDAKYDEYNMEYAYNVLDKDDLYFLRLIISSEEDNYQLKVLSSGKILEVKKLVSKDDNQDDDEEEEE